MNGIQGFQLKGWATKSLSIKRITINGFFVAASFSACHGVFAATAPGGPGGGTPPSEPQVVATSTTHVASNLNPSLTNQAVTFTATVGGASPTGTVVFKRTDVYDSASSQVSNFSTSSAPAYTQDSMVMPGCENVVLSGGTAQCTVVIDQPGTWDISAEYAGDSINAPSAGTLAGGQVVKFEWPMLSTRKLGSGFVVGGGVDCGSECRSYYPPGSTVTLTANPNTHIGFKAWHGCDAVNGSDCTVTVNVDRTVTAEFESDSVPSNDFNDDGRSDIVWRNSAGGDSVLWLMNGGNAPSAISLDTNAANTATFAGDFNGDGKTDLVWVNSSTGQVSIALMNGGAVISRTAVSPPASGFAVTQVGDFNGDGKSDLLWLGADNSTVITLMDGATKVTTQAITSAGTGWVAVQVGDFNDDGRTDILWQDAFGAAAIWLMDGVNVQSGAMILGPGSNYFAQFLGDFDGDGRADILWKAADGSYDVWIMKGTETIRSAKILEGGTNMNVIHVADFDGEGRSDLVFDGGDGTVSVWQMNALAVARTTTYPSLGRSVKLARDFTGDGKADLLWGYSDGSYVLWTMDGGKIVETSTVRQAGNTYQAMP